MQTKMGWVPFLSEFGRETDILHFCCFVAFTLKSFLQTGYPIIYFTMLAGSFLCLRGKKLYIFR